MIEITEERYEALRESERILNALYANGVDNWEWYVRCNGFNGGGHRMNPEQYELNNILVGCSTQDLIEEIKRRIGTPTTVSIKIFINAEGYELEEVHRTLESLKSRGISMKNVFGGYIKKEATE